MLFVREPTEKSTLRTDAGADRTFRDKVRPKIPLQTGIGPCHGPLWMLLSPRTYVASIAMKEHKCERHIILLSVRPLLVDEPSIELYAVLVGVSRLNGSFRCSASLVISHRISFAAIMSVSGVHLGHMNRNVSVPNKSQHKIALI